MEKKGKGTREAPNTPCFVKKLYEVSDHAPQPNRSQHLQMMTFNPKILTWVSGEAFEILDPVRLESEVLPFFFRHCRFQSLVRQLNFYAFKVSFPHSPRSLILVAENQQGAKLVGVLARVLPAGST